MPINRSHDRYLSVLLGQAAGERFPSHRILERIEAAITDRPTAEAYVDLLLGHAEEQRYPSLRMVDRAARVVTQMAIADTAARLAADRTDTDGDGGG